MNHNDISQEISCQNHALFHDLQEAARKRTACTIHYEKIQPYNASKLCNRFFRLQYNALQLIPAKNTAAEYQDKPTPCLYRQAQNARVQATCSIPFAEWRGVRIT